MGHRNHGPNLEYTEQYNGIIGKIIMGNQYLLFDGYHF